MENDMETGIIMGYIGAKIIANIICALMRPLVS